MNTNIENIKKMIIDYFNSNEETFNECIEELDNYNGYLDDRRYYPMEELNEFYHNTEPLELLYRTFYGHDEDNYTIDQSGNKTYCEFNPNREYFSFNGYGNLVSSDYKDYSDLNDHWFIDSLLKNRENIYIINENSELSKMFDRLEEEIKKEGK